MLKPSEERDFINSKPNPRFDPVINAVFISFNFIVRNLLFERFPLLQQV